MTQGEPLLLILREMLSKTLLRPQPQWSAVLRVH
jgi:hypothetical protein